jgi:ATP-binding cassette subfamily B protein
MSKLLKDIKCVIRTMNIVQSLAPHFIALLLLQALFTALSPFVMIYMSGKIIDELSRKSDINYLLMLVAVSVTAGFIIHLVTKLFDRAVNIKRTLFNYEYEMNMGEKVLSMDYESVEDHDTHMKLAQIRDIAEAVGFGVGMLIFVLPSLVRDFFTMVFSVSLAFRMFTFTDFNNITSLASFIASGYFSIILLFLILANTLAAMRLTSISSAKSHTILAKLASSNRTFSYYFDTFLSGYKAGKDIRLYNQRKVLMAKKKGLFDFVHAIFRENIKFSTKYRNISIVLSSTISLLVYMFAGIKALVGMISIGSIVIYIESISRFTEAFRQFMVSLAHLRANTQYMDYYFDFMDIPESNKSGTIPVEKRTDNDYVIAFENVSFRYSDSDQDAIKNLNLQFKAGQKLAVVGMNGSGKTTLIKLLCRLYDPDEGRITLNGIDIRKYDFQEYMNIFSVVFQDYRLFSFSLANNVATSNEYDEQRIKQNLEKAGFIKRFTDMPQGIETPLYKDFDEDGVEISGGEAQKIALARALYKDAPFIILDEPTAALDPIAEYEIYTKFNDIVGNKTAIYISHRLSSCRFCDDIAVLHEGQLIQRGNHDSLVADQHGKYHELWTAQAQYYQN